jgi:hypothetical protein
MWSYYRKDAASQETFFLLTLLKGVQRVFWGHWENMFYLFSDRKSISFFNWEWICVFIRWEMGSQSRVTRLGKINILFTGIRHVSCLFHWELGNKLIFSVTGHFIITGNWDLHFFHWEWE